VGLVFAAKKQEHLFDEQHTWAGSFLGWRIAVSGLSLFEIHNSKCTDFIFPRRNAGRRFLS
jgi:hypothetical protein